MAYPQLYTSPAPKRCAATHPKMPITVGYRTYVITGGSVHDVKATDFDVMIAFEGSYKGSTMALPWTLGVEFTYRITDGCAPGNPKNFRLLVEWVAQRLMDGDKVFCGCIGGHGRTGMFLAALVQYMTGDADAIAYVRKHYCKKAVESERQVNFLHTEYGIKARAGSKQQEEGNHTWQVGSKWRNNTTQVPGAKKPNSSVRELYPVLTDLSIHGDNEIVK